MSRRERDGDMPLARDVLGGPPVTEAQLKFDLDAINVIAPVPDEPLRERFRRFHAANPKVYAALVSVAMDLRARGFAKCGVCLLFERLRWLYALQTRGDSYRLNNSYRAFYSRMIMEREADLAGFFEIRRQPTENLSVVE